MSLINIDKHNLRPKEQWQYLKVATPLFELAHHLHLKEAEGGFDEFTNHGRLAINDDLFRKLFDTNHDQKITYQDFNEYGKKLSKAGGSLSFQDVAAAREAMYQLDHSLVVTVDFDLYNFFENAYPNGLTKVELPQTKTPTPDQNLGELLWMSASDFTKLQASPRAL